MILRHYEANGMEWVLCDYLFSAMLDTPYSILVHVFQYFLARLHMLCLFCYILLISAWCGQVLILPRLFYFTSVSVFFFELGFIFGVHEVTFSIA